MIITQSKPYAEIKKRLHPNDKVGIVACNVCARICGTGGEKGIKKLAGQLKEDGFEVVDTDLIGTPCVYDQLEAAQLRGNVTIVLTCDAGLHILRKVFPGEKLIAGLDTIGVGAVNEEGKPILVKGF